MAYQGSNLFKKRHQNTTLLALSINRLEYFLLQLNDGDLLVAWMRVHEHCATPRMPQWWWVLEPPNRGFEVNFDAIGTFQPNVWKFEILCNAFGLIMTEVWWYALSFYKRWRSNRKLVKWTHNFYPNNFTYGGLTLWRERFTFSIIKHWNFFWTNR